MRKSTLLCGFLIGISLISCSTYVNSDELKNDNDFLSYYLGVYTGLKLKEAGYTEFNEEAFQVALDEVFKSKHLDYDAFYKSDSIVGLFFMRAKMLEDSLMLGKSIRFMNENAKKEGVVVKESGLQYKIIRLGNGQLAKDGDTVVILIKGMTFEGVEFRNNYKNGPDTIPIKNGTPGGIEALQTLPVGSKYIFYLPSELAFGQQPLPGGILKNNMSIVYEIELLSIL